MQYFSGEMKLSKDILKEIYDETKPQLSSLNQIIVLQGIPSGAKREDDPSLALYTREILI